MLKCCLVSPSTRRQPCVLQRTHVLRKLGSGMSHGTVSCEFNVNESAIHAAELSSNRNAHNTRPRAVGRRGSQEPDPYFPRSRGSVFANAVFTATPQGRNTAHNRHGLCLELSSPLGSAGPWERRRAPLTTSAEVALPRPLVVGEVSALGAPLGRS